MWGKRWDGWIGASKNRTLCCAFLKRKEFYWTCVDGRWDGWVGINVWACDVSIGRERESGEGRDGNGKGKGEGRRL